MHLGAQRFSFIMLQLPGLSVNNIRQKQVQGCGLSWCCRLQRPFHQPPPTSAKTASGTEWEGGSHPPPTSGLLCQKFICSKSSPFLGLDRKVGEQKFKFRGLLQSLHYKPHWLILLAENPLFTSVNNLLQICSSCAPVQGWWSEPQLTPAEAKPTQITIYPSYTLYTTHTASAGDITAGSWLQATYNCKWRNVEGEWRMDGDPSCEISQCTQWLTHSLGEKETSLAINPLFVSHFGRSSLRSSVPVCQRSPVIFTQPSNSVTPVTQDYFYSINATYRSGPCYTILLPYNTIQFKR